MADTKDIWYNLTAEKTLESLGTSTSGLSAEEAKKRLADYGPNELKRSKKMSAWRLFLEQFKDLLIIILLIAVVLSAFLGETVDAIVIFIIVLFAAGLGFIQEYRAERSIEALNKLAAPMAHVIRDGRNIDIPAVEAVPGDIVILKTGDRMPADGRLLESVNLRADEASLTGESTAVEKNVEPIVCESGIGDRRNMIFAGTASSYGRGTAVVTATGMNTEFGKIATLLQEVEEEKTPLQVNLDRMGRYIVIGALALTFVLAVLGVARGHKPLEMLLWGVSLAVAAVPEALPAVVTVSLSLGVQKMAKRHALIRKLSAVETLGSTTYICSDKTGTLTQDQMTIRRVFVDGKLLEISGSGYEPKGEFLSDGAKFDPTSSPPLQRLLIAGILCNDTALVNDSGSWDVKGDPTEGALVVLAAKAGIDHREFSRRTPRVHEIPFTSESKRMATVHEMPEGHTAMAKGAAEVILDDCRYILIGNRETELNEAQRKSVLEAAGTMADAALRVLGLAYKNTFVSESDNELQKNMVFLGLVGMIDPPRPEVKDAIKECDAAGIRTVMITGDHKATAVAIARELGLVKGGLAYSGAELDRLSQPDFDKQVENIDVYARVSPSHKLRVVEALEQRGHVVAMTGDGVNDAPALKKADIGIAMGISGTDVTKEAAGMILTDDNFASIVAAVEEGRGIFSNIKKYLVYLLSSNLGEILLMAMVVLFGPLMGLPSGVLPLVTIQILFVNLATDGLPAIALSVDPPEPGLMRQKPRPRRESIFTRPVTIYMLLAGAWTAAVTLGVFLWAMKTRSGPADQVLLEAQSLCFVALILVEFFNAFNCRSLDHSIFKVGFFKNKWLVLSIASQILLLLAIVYWHPLQVAFKTFALNGEEWLIAVVSASTIFFGLELYKLLRKVFRRKSE
jgi:P-type Ca2+ transporter type 2C